jgi:hypothetical protein
MIRRVGVLLVLLAVASCRNYDLYPRLSSDAGLVPGDQYARYGKEQAQAVAIARRMAQVDPTGHMDSALAYARTLPDVADVTPDSAGHRLTVGFRSGWRVGVVPLADGKAPGETPGLAAPAPR